MDKEWKSVDKKLPEYYDLIWCSDGVGVALGRMTGRSFDPPRTIFKNFERDGCDCLSGVKFWKKCKRPKI